MKLFSDRIYREKKTIEKMIGIYCQKVHHRKQLCGDCKSMLAYSHRKLDKCPFHQEKPACSECKVHCYHKSEREHIREIMRFAGPKMLLKSPVLAIMHIIDQRTIAPKELKKNRENLPDAV
jgi:hypothetical protein